jgi:hypothetical protein
VNTRSLGGVSNNVYLFIKEFGICVVHTVDNNKLQMNFEVIVL